MKNKIYDVRFWILMAFIIRLIGITNAPLETGHNWRQTTVTMVARNYLEVDNNIFYPRVDFAGDKTGITGMEFPILNYSIYLVSEVFGYQHWYGRLINLIVSSFGIWFFFLLVRKYIKKRVAFNASIILLFSIWFMFSRKIMPDTFSVSFILMGMYYGSNYFDRKESRLKSILLFALFTLIGTLAKIPALFIMVLFLHFIFRKKVSNYQKVIFCFVSFLIMIPVWLWYFYWVPHLVEKYGFWHFFMGQPYLQGIKEIFNRLPDTLDKFYYHAVNYVGFIVFLITVGYMAYHRKKHLLIFLAVCTFAFVVFVFKAGNFFANHNYYIIPFVPIMAIVIGYGLSKIPKRYAFMLLVVISLENVLNNHQDFWLKKSDRYILTLEEDLDKVINREDLILLNTGEIPSIMYFAHRKGWISYNDNISRDTYLAHLKEKGLKYVLVLKKKFGEHMILPNREIKIDNENYTLYKL